MDNIFYVNIGESQYRDWDDCRQYGFLAAGGSQRRINQISGLEPENLVAAYLKGSGYVGIGLVEEKAVPIDEFLYKGLSLSKLPLTKPEIFTRAGQHNICDHLVRIKWLVTADRSMAKWEKGLFASQNVKASLSSQPTTIAFLEREFRIAFDSL